MKYVMVIVALLAVPAIAFAGTANTLDLLSGGSASVSVAQGGTLTVDAILDLSVPAAGYQFQLQASATGAFDVTADVASTVIFVGGMPLGTAVGGLDTTSGITGVMGFVDQPAASFPATIRTFTIVVDAAAPVGMYTISPVGVVVADALAMSVPLTSITGLAVNVTPEPATMLLLAGALPFLRRRRMA